MSTAGLQFAQEKLSLIRDEAYPLLLRHWEEIALNKASTPLDPAWHCKMLEDAGVFHVTTTRIDGVLVGYVAFLIAPNLHYRTVIEGAVISFGLSAIGNALLGQKKPSVTADSGSTANRTQQIRQSIAPHQIILGSVKVSGVLAYIYSPNVAKFAFASAVKGNAPADFKLNEMLYTIVVLAGHPVSAIHDIKIDDTASNDPKFSGLAYVEAALGAADQAANAAFMAETDGEWSVNHRLRGRPALYCIFDYDQSAFSGVPNPAAIVDGAMPYNPRTGETVWSDNAALLIAWYLTQDFGMRLEWEEIDEASLIAAANICDEQVGLLDGTSENRIPALVRSV